MYARLPLDREEGPVLEYSLDDRQLSVSLPDVV